MLARRARIWFLVFLAYVAALSYLLASVCEGRQDWWAVPLLIGGLTVGSAAPVLTVRYGVLRNRTRRWGAAFRQVGPAVGNWSALISLGVLLSMMGQWAARDWLQGLGLGISLLSVGMTLWTVLRALPSDEPPDGVGEA